LIAENKYMVPNEISQLEEGGRVHEKISGMALSCMIKLKVIRSMRSNLRGWDGRNSPSFISIKEVIGVGSDKPLRASGKIPPVVLI
jgi:hypothetical protein